MSVRERYSTILLALFLMISMAISLSCDESTPAAEETSTTVSETTISTTSSSSTASATSISSTTSSTSSTSSTASTSSVSTADPLLSVVPTPSTSISDVLSMTTTAHDDHAPSKVTSDPPNEETTNTPGHYVTSAFPVAEIYENVSPAVVSVRVSIPATSLYRKRDEIFSGLIIDESGLVITTYSLMERALDYRGRLLKNASISILVKGIPKAFTATLVGHQSSTDLALLKIGNPDKLIFHAIPLAKDVDLYVGTQVASIGYPPMMVSAGGLTMGYVTSFYRRTYEEDGAPLGLIETSISTLPIYAGSPLVNAKGEVVAIVSGYLKRVYVQNQGYAVPSTIVADVVNRIQEKENGGPTRKAALGITVLSDEDTLEIRETYGYPNGLYISTVKPESAAYTAGLNQGDILQTLNGVSMELTQDLIFFLDEQAIGTLVEIVVYRPSEDKTLTLTTYLLEVRP
ncbi:MAG TPA: serine protease [Clostridiaceae bacterium]|nr:serine protease [Clostridiaceae bacterium]